MSWEPPKTIWITTEKFNIADYNRIKNNVAYLSYAAGMSSGIGDLEDLGADISSYSAMWDYKKFNAMENNLEKITRAWLPRNQRFIHKTYYPGGKFIDASELSRIESVCVVLKPFADNWENGRMRIPFRFGDDRKIRV